jgi:hypothetical protein
MKKSNVNNANGIKVQPSVAISDDEIIIACAIESELGFWGVGESHGHAETDLMNSKDTFVDRIGFDRKMLTSEGRLVSLKDAWVIAEKAGMPKMGKLLKYFWVVTSEDFANLPTYDIKRAKQMAMVHNLQVKRMVQGKLDRAARWEMRPDGD